MPKLKIEVPEGSSLVEEGNMIVWEDNEDFKEVDKQHIDRRRHYSLWRATFKQESTGKYYQAEHKVDETEMGEIKPFEYDDKVIFIEVKPVEKTITVYEPVPDEDPTTDGE